MSDGKVLIEVDLNDKGVNSALDNIENKAIKSGNNIGNSVSKLSDQSLDMAKNAALGIVGISAAFAGLSIKAAGELSATNAQFETVFGGLQTEAQKSIDKMADEFGMVNSRLKPSMSKMTSMFKGLGMDTADAMGLATDAVTLSADAAAFYDVAYEDANASLSSFLKGNYEAGESIGIFANDTQLATYAIEKGVVSSTAEWQKLDEATKQATRLEYAKNMQEMAGATGQAARESDGLENVMGNVKQAFTDLAAAFGTPLLAPFIAAAKSAVGVVNGLSKAFSENPALVYAVAGAVGTLATAFGSVFIIAKVTEEIKRFKEGIGLVRSSVALVSNPVFLAVLAIGALITAFVYFYKTSEGFRNAVNKILAPLKSLGPIFSNIGAVIKTVARIFKAFFTDFEQVGKLNGVLHEILPEGVATSLFNSVMKISHAIESLINAFEIISGVATGSISSMEELGNIMPSIFEKGGRFSDSFNKTLFSIGTTIKSLIDAFKDMVNPTKKAGESIDFVKVAFAILKGVALALLGPIGLVIKIVELVARALGGGDVRAGIQKMLDGFSDLASGVKEAGGQVGSSVGDMLAGILTAIGSALPGIISGALSIIAGFISGLAQGLPQVALAATHLIIAFTGSMLLLIPTIAASATLLIVALLGSLALGLPQIILAGINLIVSLIAGLTSGIPQYVIAITNLIVVFLASITASLPAILLAGTNLLIAFLQGLIDNLPKIVETVGTLITTFLDAITEKLPSIIESGTNLLVAWLQGIADNLPKVITAAVNVIVAFLSGIAKELPRIVTAAVSVIVAFLNGIANNLPRIITSAVNLIVAFLRGIASQIDRIVNAAMDLVDAMVRGILQAQNRLTTAVIDLMNGMARNIERSAPQMRSAAGRLITAIIGALPGGALINAGIALASGLLKGLVSGFNKVKETVSGWAGWIKDHKGPISYDKKLLIEAGQAIVYGLNRGLTDSFSDVKQTVMSLTGMISDTFEKGIRVNPLEYSGIAVGDVGFNDSSANKAVKSIQAARDLASKVVSSIPSAEMAMGINNKMSTSYVGNGNNKSGMTTVTNDNGVTIHIEKIENHSDSDIPKILEEAAWIMSRDKGRLGYE